MTDRQESSTIDSDDDSTESVTNGPSERDASRSSDGDEGPLTVPAGPGGSLALHVPPAATSEETAAIVAAIGTHVGDLERAADASEPDWHGRRWAFAGRLAATSGRADRVPLGAPLDEWSAASRADRF